MPQNEEVTLVRKKYGINKDDVVDESKSNFLRRDETRNYDQERSFLLGAMERNAKIFHKQLAQGDCMLDNDSRFVEEFCTIIELCIQHGWKSKFLIKHF
jgi:hypothetical protein